MRLRIDDNQQRELIDAVRQESRRIGMNPQTMMTIMAYETGGTLDPWQDGPTTQWGQHRGLIQMGGPQRQQYGYRKGAPISDLVRASADYFVDRGWQPGMSELDAYSIVNAGSPGLYHRTDEFNGGAPGTVADKVAGRDWASYRDSVGEMLSSFPEYSAELAEYVEQTENANRVQPMPVDTSLQGLFNTPSLPGIDGLTPIERTPAPSTKPVAAAPRTRVTQGADLAPLDVGQQPATAANQPASIPNGFANAYTQYANSRMQSQPMSPSPVGAAPRAPVTRGADLARLDTGPRSVTTSTGSGGLFDYGIDDALAGTSALPQTQNTPNVANSRISNAFGDVERTSASAQGFNDFGGLAGTQVAPRNSSDVANSRISNAFDAVDDANANTRVNNAFNAVAEINAPELSVASASFEDDAKSPRNAFPNGYADAYSQYAQSRMAGQIARPSAGLPNTSGVDVQEPAPAYVERPSALRALSPAQTVPQRSVFDLYQNEDIKTVPGAIPDVSQTVKNFGGLADPGRGMSYGYSPYGSGVALVHDSAPQQVKTAATGPGLFGAFERDFGIDLEPAAKKALAWNGAMVAGPAAMMGGAMLGGITGAQLAGMAPSVAALTGNRYSNRVNKMFGDPFADQVASQQQNNNRGFFGGLSQSLGGNQGGGSGFFGGLSNAIGSIFGGGGNAASSNGSRQTNIGFNDSLGDDRYVRDDSNDSNRSGNNRRGTSGSGLSSAASRAISSATRGMY